MENVTDENNPVMLNYPGCNITTETSCTFPFSFVDLCEQYAATVVPFSEAGQGNSSRGLLNSHPDCTSDREDVDLDDNDLETPQNENEDEMLIYILSITGGVVLLAILVCVTIAIGVVIWKWRGEKTTSNESMQELEEIRQGDPPSAEEVSESNKDEGEVILVATNDTTEKMDEREVVEEEEMKPETALTESHQIPSDIPENKREQMGVAEGEDGREKKPQMTLKEPSYLPTEMKKVAEEERIRVDQESHSQRTIAGGVTEGGVEDLTPFKSAQPVKSSSSQQGEGFVAGSHYVSVSNTERPLLIEREEATAETSAVTSVEEESHEDSTAMIAPTSDMSSRDEGTGEYVATKPSKVFLPKSSPRLQRKTSQDREHDKKEEQNEGMKSLLQAYQENKDADVLEGK
ncbi:hypothetical protein GBAR_LOCUS12879 [Geodia barretti]|uniref:Uncharacterized protein n=1 Tax=Geodia barretti TaxID=519541 RepID=A0AA35WIP4_GEOBA|nr:hypothetical protein GBAR_LOCUS12879 [Geodia barretti]